MIISSYLQAFYTYSNNQKSNWLVSGEYCGSGIFLFLIFLSFSLLIFLCVPYNWDLKIGKVPIEGWVNIRMIFFLWLTCFILREEYKKDIDNFGIINVCLIFDIKYLSNSPLIEENAANHDTEWIWKIRIEQILCSLN